MGNYKGYYLAKSQKRKAEVSKQVAIMFAKQTFATLKTIYASWLGDFARKEQVQNLPTINSIEPNFIYQVESRNKNESK